MRNSAWLSLAALVAVPALTLAAGVDRHELDRVNRRIAGKVIDYTDNHGADRRFYSNALEQKRDMYVYLPPAFDANKCYPLMVFLHGYTDDEGGFLKEVVCSLDAAILNGQLPPLIAVAPDGTLVGTPNRHDAGSFFINSKAGDFQDFIVRDVYEYMLKTYPIRPEREAHVLAGASMGGFGAFNIALKHRDKFKIVVGIMPALNLRWMNLCGDYMANFDPYDWGWRNTNDNPHEILGVFHEHLIVHTMRKLIYPVFGSGPEAVWKAWCENPIELVDRTNLAPGELDMWVGYAEFDEFNLDAQAESFIYLAQSRGIRVSVLAVGGNHSERTARAMIPDLMCWLNAKLQGYNVHVPTPKTPSKELTKPAAGN